jgi:cation diffusion facilitator family transporter
VSVGQRFHFPDAQWEARRRARRVAWLSIGLLLSGTVVLFLTVGSSQAMKTAWISDLVTAIPPAALLIAMPWELRPPTTRFPYGYFRSISVAFLVTAAVLTLIGVDLFIESALKLVHGERPAIGTMVLLGHRFWAGWAMIAALAYSMSIGVVLGVLKKPIAEELHDKELEAESKMNRAEWMSEGAAIIGILLVAWGHWWGDALAAALISLDIIFDGWQSLRQVIADLMDESPTQMGKTALEPLPGTVQRAAEALPWVERAAVRLREQGHVLTGEVFVVPRDGDSRTAHDLVADAERAGTELCQVDWRLHNLTVIPVATLESVSPPRT